MPEVIRVRLAPSPTGKFHIGTARTALFNYLFARKFDGKFIVRIEDTDKTRSEDTYTKDILSGLRWLGLMWDEGPEVGGGFGPYFQQERTSIYRDYVEKLISENKAYRCYCSNEELEEARKINLANGEPPKYSGKCRHLSAPEREKHQAQGTPYVVRFIVEPQSIVINDLIRGEVQFDANLIGDFIIVRSDQTPLFVLTNVIDDQLMEISHVLRGEEHLPNAAKQILLCEALSFLPPQYGHFPLIFNADRTKMSKRKDPVSVTDDYKAKGYLPEAIVNYLALLGWNPGTDREIFNMHELISEFQIERVGKSPSIFDPDKLLWMNGHYLRNSLVGTVAESAKAFITDDTILKKIKDDPYYYLRVIATAQDRLKILNETEELISLFYQLPKYDKSLLIAKKSNQENALKSINIALEVVKEINILTRDESEAHLRPAARKNNLSDGELLWTVRAALSGKTTSPGVFELLEVLGREESTNRLKKAKKKLIG